MTRISWLAIVVAATFTATGSAELQTAATPRPTFEDFPVTEIFKGTPSPPVLSSPQARLFRTQLRRHAAYGADFAGHFKLALWGCGMGCVSVAVIDSITGAVYFAPFRYDDGFMPRIEGQPPKVLCHHVSDYRIDSELFIAEGEIGDKIGTHFYRWHDKQFTLVHFDTDCTKYV